VETDLKNELNLLDMKRVFDESFKKIAVDLSYLKESVSAAAKELDLDASRLSK